MKIRTIISFLIVCLHILISAQPSMEAGFEMLNSSRYQEAVAFFERIIETFPENKTATICYGRAVGLDGNPVEAYQIFLRLEDSFPSDTEVQLNLAEALMWQSQFIQAKDIYSSLIMRDATNFTALLGIANAYASTFQYDSAYHFIENALTLQPKNSNALTSKKYIILGLSNNAKNNLDYEQGHQYLDEILSFHPQDEAIWLLRADLFLSEQKYQQAKRVYSQMILDSTNLFQAFKGIAYVNMVLRRNIEAISNANKAENFAKSSSEILSIQLLKANILGAMRKYKSALSVLDSIRVDESTEIHIQSRKAQIMSWSKDYKSAQEIYQQLYRLDSSRYETLIGLAEYYAVQNDPVRARNVLEKMIKIHPMNPDGLRAYHRVLNQNRWAINSGYSRMKDNGGNLTNTYSVRINAKQFGQFRPSLFVQQKRLTNLMDRDQATVKSGVFLSSWNLDPKTQVNFSVGLNRLEQEDGSIQNQFTSGLRISRSLNAYQLIEINLSREIFDYNAGILGQNLNLTHLSLSHLFTPPTRIGFYGKVMHSFFSDKNSRSLFQGAVFYQLRNQLPSIKCGFRGNVLQFKNTHPERYFSPRNAKSGELFLEFTNLARFKNRLSYSGSIAYGIQQIELQPTMRNYRIMLEGSYSINSDLTVMAHLTAGNSIQNSIDGYAFTHAGFRFQYNLR